MTCKHGEAISDCNTNRRFQSEVQRQPARAKPEWRRHLHQEALPDFSGRCKPRWGAIRGPPDAQGEGELRASASDTRA